MSDGKAPIRPRMKNVRLRKPIVGKLLHSIPWDIALVAAAAESPPPAPDDFVTECPQCANVGRHCVVVEVALDDMPQPLAHRREWVVHAPPHLLADRLELRSHAVAPGLPFDQEATPARFTADEDEAEEVEGFRLAEPAPLAVLRRIASELDQPGLLRVKRQRKLRQPLAQCVQEALGVTLVLEADNEGLEQSLEIDRREDQARQAEAMLMASMVLQTFSIECRLSRAKIVRDYLPGDVRGLPKIPRPSEIPLAGRHSSEAGTRGETSRPIHQR